MDINENGALAYESSGDARVDYFSKIVRNTPKEEITALLEKCWNLSPDDTMKLIFQKRDCRGGNGEKDIFHISLIWVWVYHSKSFLKNIHHIPEYGSYKDWCKLVEKDHSLRFLIGKEFAKQLKIDLKCIETHNTSLCAKYAPSEKHEYDIKIPGFLNIITKEFSENVCCRKDYRKALTKLRSKIKIVETQMCENDWENIDYSKVPSRATYLYKNAFRKHNPEKYQEWLDKVMNKESKVNASQLQPHEIAGHYLNKMYDNDGFVEDQLVEAQWVQLLNDLSEECDFRNCVAMPDMSGSMFGLPMNVSATLGILVAKVAAKQGSKFGDLLITFSDQPSFLDLSKSDKLVDNVKTLAHGCSNGFNTDLYKAFAIIIEKSIEKNVATSEFPEKIIIFTDMQFDEAVEDWTIMDSLDDLFDKSPYSRPQIVCWNLRNVSNVCVTSSHQDVALVSGFSKDMFKNIMNNVITTPYDVMRNTIDNPRYDKIMS